ncbi:class II glutamine amidotransferase [Hellea sp.]|nr:class II glutamine amidotransferase [Hellea sp.]
MLLNFDAPSSPSIHINLSENRAGTNTLGWGLGWYPGDQSSSMVIKDPVARSTQVFTDSLSEWSNFRSNIFFCKIRGAESGYSQSETQPFTRTFAGADWLFMHNGDLDKTELTQVYEGDSRLLEPVGNTDSELAFCNLLARMEQNGSRGISDVNPTEILSWFQRFDQFGSADMYLTDGKTICCFQGTQSQKPLRYSRLLPPNNLQSLSSSAVNIALDNSQDTFRTAVVVSSAEFSSGNWTPLQPGQMIMLNRGKIIWDSLNPDQNWSPAIDTSKRPFAQKQFESPALLPTQAPQSQTTITQAQNVSIVQDFVTSPRTITQTMSGRSLAYRMFDVQHSTFYEYAEPVEHSTHLFRLMPIDDICQEVLHSKLSLTSGAEKIQFEDVFGNQSVHCTIKSPYQNLVVKAASRVKLYEAPPDDNAILLRQTSIPLIWMPWQRQMMTPYLLPPELPETQLRELTNYAMSFVARNDHNLLRTIEDINASIYSDFEYVSGSTTNDTTPFEVYANRKGVCQDFANLFICLARLLSLPARYRMGYIYTGENYANKIQSEASHAWVEVYLPYVGWRGFDPTNGCRASQDHVRVAIGRNYIDATPTSGTIYKGGGVETLRVEVKLTEVRE